MNDGCLDMSEDDFMIGAKWLCEKLMEMREISGAALLLHDWKMTNSSSMMLLEHSPVIQRVAHCQRKKQEHVVEKEEVYMYDESILIEDSIETTEALDNELPCSLLEWKFTVVYSHVWRVPVLYFQVYTSEGALLSREEVLTLLLKDESSALKGEDSWTFLSHEEHPMTGMPSFFLHPCQTAKRLGILMNSSDGHDKQGKILFCWLSMILPSVGFRISPRLLY